MAFETTGSTEASVLKLAGNWTIERAVELKGALLEALNSGEHILIDVEELTGADLSAVQLLCSAHHASVRRGKLLELRAPKAEAFRRTVRDAGMARTIGCHKDPKKGCLWTGDWNS